MTRTRIVSLVATGAQIGVAIVRVAGFSYAVLTIGRDPTRLGFLIAVGYLPFIAFFDILVQSFSRVSSVRRTYSLADIAQYRISYALLSLASVAVAATWVSARPEYYGYLLVMCYLLGAFGYLWEGWLALPSRSLAFASLEISILSAVVASHYLGYLPVTALLICFVSFPLARLAVLLIPGRSPPESGESQLRSANPTLYIGFSLAQQSAGAISASLPTIYAQALGTYAGLPTQLASFRIMHALGAMASLVINALGSRIFYRQASIEINAIERAINFLDRYKTALDALIIFFILFLYSTGGSIIFCIFLYASIISMENFYSSYYLNKGYPIFTFCKQVCILVLSISAIGFLNHVTALFLAFLGIYVVLTRMLKFHGAERLGTV